MGRTARVGGGSHQHHQDEEGGWAPRTCSWPLAVELTLPSPTPQGLAAGGPGSPRPRVPPGCAVSVPRVLLVPAAHALSDRGNGKMDWAGRLHPCQALSTGLGGEARVRIPDARDARCPPIPGRASLTGTGGRRKRVRGEVTAGMRSGREVGPGTSSPAGVTVGLRAWPESGP